MKPLFLSALLLLCCLAARAEDNPITDAQSLRRWCVLMERMGNGENLNESDAAMVVYGSGYLHGFLDSCALNTNFGMVMPFDFPSQSTNLQAAVAIQKFIDNHPQFLKHPASITVVGALAEAFPNPKYVNPNLKKPGPGPGPGTDH